VRLEGLGQLKKSGGLYNKYLHKEKDLHLQSCSITTPAFTCNNTEKLKPSRTTNPGQGKWLNELVTFFADNPMAKIREQRRNSDQHTTFIFSVNFSPRTLAAKETRSAYRVYVAITQMCWRHVFLREAMKRSLCFSSTCEQPVPPLEASAVVTVCAC
jgi:hypothetical protein